MRPAMTLFYSIIEAHLNGITSSAFELWMAMKGMNLFFVLFENAIEQNIVGFDFVQRLTNKPIPSVFF